MTPEPPDVCLGRRWLAPGSSRVGWGDAARWAAPGRLFACPVADLSCFDDGAHHRCRAASEVQRCKATGPLDLVASRLSGHLQVAVEQHPYPGRPDRVAAADEAAAGIDGQLAISGGDAAVDRVAAAPGLGDPEVVDGQVLGDCEAVVGLDAVELEDVVDPGPGEGVGDRVPNGREYVVSVGAGIELVLQVQGGIAVPPASNPRNGSTNSAPVLTQP